MRVASNRWICPVCSRPVGASLGNGLARHGGGCTGTGVEVYGLQPYIPPVPAAVEVPESDGPEPPPWIPPAVPVDRAPFRRWRSYGWTPEQIAAVTGPGALW